MSVRSLKKGIYYVGAIDWDRRLFDQLIPLPEGTTYNSYLVLGSEKTALVDSVDKSKEQEMLRNLKRLSIDRLDYIVSNHAEQDHSEGIVTLLEMYPEAKVVTNPKCKGFLIDLLLIPEEKFVEVNEGDTLSLGDRTLEFIMAPWVHWPETMLTYLREDKVLFPCDLFGSHLASSDLFAIDEARVYPSAKRYYAQIMMPFRSQIVKHMEKLKDKEIDMIAPSHGPVYNKPEFILNAYRDWISDKVKNEVVLPFVSMHGSTKKMVDHLINLLMDRGISVQPFNLVKCDMGELAMSLVDTATLVIATPTVLVGPHPAAVYATYLVNALRPKTRFASIIGSFGWGGRAVEQITGMLGNLKAEILEPVVKKGHPREDVYTELERLADEILEKHKEAGIIQGT
jgi:flavorubredoxin